ncbi:phosphatidate cytidylyltransferase [Alkaliphilus transvaalensis]|nr:phosphatidate cytidylyltransferase [Alkaliphilus transvaalensis]
MLKRFIGGALVVIVVTLSLTNIVTFFAFIMLISLLAVNELYRAFENKQSRPMIFEGVLLTGALLICFAIRDYYLLYFVVITFFFAAKLLFAHNKYNVVDIATTIFGILYIGLMLGHSFFFIKHDYFFMIWLVFIIAWATDTSAYFSGYLFGNKKLCPEISPKKTVEGAIGGICGSVLASAAFAYIMIPEQMFLVILLGFLGSITSQIGDLIASAIKRHAGIKDFGNIVPGHGGILDRFDSIIFTIPLVYYFVTYIMV